MSRIAIVNQRYGKEVNGGSEDYARELAHRLSAHYKVDVITTTALDYQDWEEYYPAGTEKDAEVTVRRFPVKLRRLTRLQNFLSRSVFHTPLTAWLCDRLWVLAQGPFSPAAVRFLKKNADRYEAVIFVTYLYYLTAAGLPEIRGKAILVPTAHDEFPIRYPYYRKLLAMPAAFSYLTEEEKRLVEGLAPVNGKPHTVAGAGVSLPEEAEVKASLETFREKYGIRGDYVIYAGRVDEAKGCREMFRDFAAFKEKQIRSGGDRPEDPEELTLVVIGKMMLPDPGREDIRCLGFVSEEEKYAAIYGASVLLLPSQYESLSISVLEALGLGTPVLVNAKSEVLKAHCEKSGAGKYYGDPEEFRGALGEMLSDPEKLKEMGARGRQYVRENYSWDRTIRKYRELIETVGRNGTGGDTAEQKEKNQEKQ